jgi:hypothetical protein
MDDKFAERIDALSDRVLKREQAAKRAAERVIEEEQRKAENWRIGREQWSRLVIMVGDVCTHVNQRLKPGSGELRWQDGPFDPKDPNAPLLCKVVVIEKGQATDFVADFAMQGPTRVNVTGSGQRREQDKIDLSKLDMAQIETMLGNLYEAFADA